MKTKQITNEKMLKDLLANLSSIEIALLRERIVTIMEQTTKSIGDNPEPWLKNPIIHPNAYIRLAKTVDEYIGFGKE